MKKLAILALVFGLMFSFFASTFIERDYGGLNPQRAIKAGPVVEGKRSPTAFVCTLALVDEDQGWPFAVKAAKGSNGCTPNTNYPLGYVLNFAFYTFLSFLVLFILRKFKALP